jgi:hypothetical protein
VLQEPKKEGGVPGVFGFADAGTDRVGDRCFVSLSNVGLTSALGSSHAPLWLVLRADS